MARRVVITGAGLISTLGHSPAALHHALCQGRKGVRLLQQSTPNGHSCRMGGPIPDFRPEKYLQGRPLRPLDRTSQLAAAAARLTLEDSGWTDELLANREVSLALGTMFGGIRTIGEFDRSALLGGPNCASAMAFANTVINAAGAQTAIWHNLRGVNTTIAAGAISGLAAIGYAADLIRSGTVDAILTGGADEFCFESFYAFSQAGVLCSDHTGEDVPVPFDTRRNGFALGEAAAFLMLESADSAKARGARVLAEVSGSANAFDCSGGRDSTSATRAIVRAVTDALARANLGPSDIDFLSSSANGSVARDCYEAVAMDMAFGGCARHLPVTAVKGGTGEALGASGPLQAISAILTLRDGLLPGITGLQDLAPDFPLRGAAAKTRQISAQHGLLNGVGLDGNSCSVALSAVDG